MFVKHAVHVHVVHVHTVSFEVCECLPNHSRVVYAVCPLTNMQYMKQSRKGFWVSVYVFPCRFSLQFMRGQFYRMVRGCVLA